LFTFIILQITWLLFSGLDWSLFFKIEAAEMRFFSKMRIYWIWCGTSSKQVSHCFQLPPQPSIF